MKKKLLAALLAAVMIMAMLPTASAAGPAADIPKELSAQSGGEFSVSIDGVRTYTYAYQVAEQVNQLRASLGLSQLVVDPELMDTAMHRAAECAVYYDHTRPNGASCFTAFPARSNNVKAENIAAGYLTPADVMNGWTNSPGHYANMTHTGVNAIGVGCFYANGRYYWAQCFTGGAYSSDPAILSDQTGTATFPVVNKYFSPAGGNGTISLRVGESRQLPVYNRNLGFNNYTTTLSGIGGATLSAGTDLVKLNSDTLTVTGVAAGSGTVTLSLPNGDTLSFPVQVTDRFDDVPAGIYFADAVAWASEEGYIVGVGKGRFDPYRTCTEAEIVTLLWRAAGRPEAAAESPLAPSLPSYYQDAINWAYGRKIIDDSFQPDAPCTRANTVYYIWLALGSDPAKTVSSFPDVSEDDYYADAVSWAVGLGIVQGSKGLYNPDGTCDRAQIATFLYRTYVPGARLK